MDKKGHCKYRQAPEKQGHDKIRGTEMPGKIGKEQNDDPNFDKFDLPTKEEGLAATRLCEKARRGCF